MGKFPSDIMIYVMTRLGTNGIELNSKKQERINTMKKNPREAISSLIGALRVLLGVYVFGGVITAIVLLILQNQNRVRSTPTAEVMSDDYDKFCDNVCAALENVNELEQCDWLEYWLDMSNYVSHVEI